MSWIMRKLAFHYGTLFVKCQWETDHVDIIVGEVFLGKRYVREVERNFYNRYQPREERPAP